MTFGNTAALGGQLATPIVVILVATECCGTVSPVNAITNLNHVIPGSGATRNFAIDRSTRASCRSGDYGNYFPALALVGLPGCLVVWLSGCLVVELSGCRAMAVFLSFRPRHSV